MTPTPLEEEHIMGASMEDSEMLRESAFGVPVPETLEERNARRAREAVARSRVHGNRRQRRNRFRGQPGTRAPVTERAAVRRRTRNRMARESRRANR